MANNILRFTLFIERTSGFYNQKKANFGFFAYYNLFSLNNDTFWHKKHLAGTDAPARPILLGIQVPIC